MRTAFIFIGLIILFLVLLAISDDMSNLEKKGIHRPATTSSPLPTTRDVTIEYIGDNHSLERWTDTKNHVVCYVRGESMSCVKM